MTTKNTLSWVVFWTGFSLCFNLGIYIIMGKAAALEYLGGYIIEQSLSVDNLFLFIMVFSSFGIKLEQQRRVLNYGIAGAIILRFIFVMLGVTIVHTFSWILYVFGGILIISGLRMMIKQEEKDDFKDSWIIKVVSKVLPVSNKLENDRFFIRKKGVLYATPLFLILILIEFTDILFAIDSIPAIFSVTTDPFIIYTSNIFAILGLRNLYFLLGRLHEKFLYVKYGVAAILIFTGIKIIAELFDMKISISTSLYMIFSLLAGSVIASLAITKEPLESKHKG